MGAIVSTVNHRHTKALYKIKEEVEDVFVPELMGNQVDDSTKQISILSTPEQSQKELSNQLRVIQKFRYRLRELAHKTLRTEQRHHVSAELAAAKTYTRHLDPAFQNVKVSVWKNGSHNDFDRLIVPNCNAELVEMKSTGQWWRFNAPFDSTETGHTDTKKMVSRAVEGGLHSLVVTQRMKEASPLKPESSGSFLCVFRRLVVELSKSNCSAGVRIIGVNKSPRRVDELQILQISSSPNMPIDVAWSEYIAPTRDNIVSLHDLVGSNLDRVCAAIQEKHHQFELGRSVKDSMLVQFKAPGRLSHGNGRAIFLKTQAASTNWVVQIEVISSRPHYNTSLHKVRLDEQRLVYAKACSEEGRTFDEAYNSLPKRMRKLASKKRKLERKRIEAVKKRQMKIAVASVNKIKEIEEQLLTLQAETTIACKRAAQVAEKTRVEQASTKILAKNYYDSAYALPKFATAVITLVGLFSDADSGDARAVHRALLSRSKGGNAKTTPISTGDASSDLLRKLLGLYMPTRGHELGAKKLPPEVTANLTYRPSIAFDHGPLPVCSTNGETGEINSVLANTSDDMARLEDMYGLLPPNIAFVTRYHSIYANIILEISPSSIGVSETLSIWHKVFVEFQVNRAARAIQCFWRAFKSKQELQLRAEAKQSAAETAAAIIVQTACRRILANKRAKRRKQQIAEEKLRAQREAEREAARKKRELQKAKKRAAAEAMKKRRDEILAKEEAERKRRGW